MKKMIAAVILAGLLCGCENLHQTARMGVSSIGDSSEPPARPANARPPTIVVGKHEFTDLGSLKIYLRSLPRGAELSWDQTSLGTGTIPLAHETATVVDLERFCDKNGIRFVIVTEYLKVFATRAYPLRSPGLRTYVEWLSRPGGMGPDGKALCMQCGVPYAADLTAFFREAGVPFPEGASVRYDTEGNRLIATNTRENDALFTKIIWSHETREFDAKVRCLAARMKPQAPLP